MKGHNKLYDADIAGNKTLRSNKVRWGTGAYIALFLVLFAIGTIAFLAWKYLLKGLVC